jgi:isoamylase
MQNELAPRHKPADGAEGVKLASNTADPAAAAGPARLAELGAYFDAARRCLSFGLYSQHASRIEVWLYARPRDAQPLERLQLERHANGRWSLELPWRQLADRVESALYYGYRAWGPNWPFDAAWAPGTESGFVGDVDKHGHRFNPNKLLLDPYAREISHDPAPRLSAIDPNEYADVYYTGPGWRALDTGEQAPKGLVLLNAPNSELGSKPKRLLKDDVLYELHVRGFSMADSSLPPELRGTFAGAGLKADYLKQLGVSAVELLPVFQFASEQNDDGDTLGDNYWGYMTLGYFAPNRRYAADRSPGGPTREFRAMVKAFHDAGIKVILDVAYNHTGEGLLKRASDGDESRTADERQFSDRACLLSFRGLDNASYYTLRSRMDLDACKPHQRYQDNSACGPNLNVTEPVVQALILDSLRYWVEEQGVDGFRFDLAPVLGNRLPVEGYAFDPDAPVLRRIREELPLRSADGQHGVDLIAEPWGVGAGTYQLGYFAPGWAQWNDRYRSVVRRAQNKLWVRAPLPHEVANVLSGSDQQLRQAPGQREARPWHSLNYVSAHDGYTLRDVFSYTGGDEGWDHGGVAAKQRKAVRNAFALLMTSAGVPMFQAGDELFRSLGGIQNPVAVDDARVYLDWGQYQRYAAAVERGGKAALAELREADEVRAYEFAREMLALRRRHTALRPERYFTGEKNLDSGLADLGWYGARGADFEAWHDPGVRFLAFRVDTSCDHEATGVRSLYVGYNWNDSGIQIALPQNLRGARWLRLVDTAEWMEPSGNVDRDGVPIQGSYGVHERSVVIFQEK